MKQTAVEFLIEKIKKEHPFWTSIFEQAKEMEKQQIIDAYQSGDGDAYNLDATKQWGEEYYTSTYGSKKSDEKINLVEIPQEQLEKERNHNYKYFDTSSQIEISDEEIEEMLFHHSNEYAYGFKDAIKWYREQLKSK